MTKPKLLLIQTPQRLELTICTALTRSLSSLMVVVISAASLVLRHTTERVLLADLSTRLLLLPLMHTITVRLITAMTVMTDTSLLPLVIWLCLLHSLQHLLDQTIIITVLVNLVETARIIAYLPPLVLVYCR